MKHTENTALLTWNTIEEINCEKFVVERSLDVFDWKQIGEVMTGYNEQKIKKYLYLDNGLNLHSGQNNVYYRLKIIDWDGGSDYSDTKTIIFNLIDEMTINIYPNPTRHILNIDLSNFVANKENIDLYIFDQNGKQVKKNIKLNQNLENINLIDLPAGTYNLVFKNGENVVSKKIVKIE